MNNQPFPGLFHEVIHAPLASDLMAGETKGTLGHTDWQMPRFPVVQIMAGKAGEFTLLHVNTPCRQLRHWSVALLAPRRWIGNMGRVMTVFFEGMTFNTDRLPIHTDQRPTVVLRRAEPLGTDAGSHRHNQYPDQHHSHARHDYPHTFTAPRPSLRRLAAATLQPYDLVVLHPEPGTELIGPAVPLVQRIGNLPATEKHFLVTDISKPVKVAGHPDLVLYRHGSP